MGKATFTRPQTASAHDPAPMVGSLAGLALTPSSRACANQHRGQKAALVNASKWWLHTLRTRFGVAIRAPRHEYRGEPGKCVTPGCRSLRLGVNSRGGSRPSGPYRSWTRATALGTAWRLGGCGCAVRALLAVNHEAETFEVMSSLSVAGGARAVVLLRGDRCTAALSAPATGHDVEPKSPRLKFQWRSCSLADVEYRGRSVHMPPVPCTDSNQD